MKLGSLVTNGSIEPVEVLVVHITSFPSPSFPPDGMKRKALAELDPSSARQGSEHINKLAKGDSASMISTGVVPDLNGKMVSTPSPTFPTPSAGSSKMAAGGDKRKKMVIKPFKVQPKLPDNFEDDTWEKLKVRSVRSFTCLKEIGP